MSNDPLTEALDRLRDFRATLAAGQVVDADSGLTADHLDTIIAALKPPADLEPGGSLSADDLGNVA